MMFVGGLSQPEMSTIVEHLNQCNRCNTCRFAALVLTTDVLHLEVVPLLLIGTLRIKGCKMPSVQSLIAMLALQKTCTSR